MLVLGIESSCDDTSIALVDCSENGHVIISEKTASQIDVHKKYGGVVPEIAGRMHAEIIVPLIEEVLAVSPLEGGAPQGDRGGVSPLLHQSLHDDQPRTGLTPPEAPSRGQIVRPDVIAVTAGPGLITGLIVGVEAARTLSYAWNIPVVAVNHLAGHIHSIEIPNDKYQIPNKTPNPNYQSLNNNGTIEQLNTGTTIQFPALALIVSGGHTELVVMENHTTYKRIGATKDDAAGECFDKVAKLLGLPYPGGPQISKLAESGRTDAIAFPRPMMKEANYDFSFAGLKTSALYWLRDNSLSAEQTTANPSAPPLGKGRTPLSPSAREGARGERESHITINDFAASFEQAIVDVLVTKTIRAAEEIKPKTIILAGGVAANKKLRQTLAQSISHNFPISNFQFPSLRYCMDNGAMIAVAGYYKALAQDFTPWEKLGANPNWKIDQKY